MADGRNRILDDLIDLFKFVWVKRAKSYVRIALALIGGGVTVLAAPPLLQFLKIIVPPTGNGAPWWAEPATGLLLVGLGVGVFLICYLRDPERSKAPPSFTITLRPRQTFEEAALEIEQLARQPVRIENFAEEERTQVLRSIQISSDSAVGVLKNLGALAVGKPITGYEVIMQDGIIVVRRP